MTPLGILFDKAAMGSSLHFGVAYLPFRTGK